MKTTSTRDFLKRRNALWQQLRAAPIGSAEFEDTLAQLSQLIGWDRPRILAGLGLSEEERPTANANDS